MHLGSFLLYMTFGSYRHIPQPNNFNIIRLMLAVYVFFVHFTVLTNCDNSALFIQGVDCVRGFFVISGFLIYASFCRASSLKTYFSNRCRRILPSYLFIVIIFSLALFFVSSCSFNEYFSTEWLRYLMYNLSFSNFAQPTLPGVFTHNTIDAVNGSLWTIKIELMCYIALPLIVYICKKIRLNPLLLLSILVLLSISYSLICNHLYNQSGNDAYLIYARQIGGQLAYFVMGMIMYESLQFVIKYRHYLLVFGLVAMTIAYSFPDASYIIKPLAIACIVIPAAFIGRWGYWLGKTDISYDFYLMHFPIIQVLIHYNLPDSIGIIPTLMLAFAVIVLLSTLSWHFIGRPFLRRKSTT